MTGEEMNEWTEYHPALDWPEGDNVKWQYRASMGWKDTDHAYKHWITGTRVRYCKRDPEMGKVFFHKAVITYHSCAQHIWIRLAAPIAAYHKDVKYMAIDENRFLHVYKNEPDNTYHPHEWHTNGEYELIAVIPKEAMPDDWKTAIVELVHEGGKDGV
jgi:hypothetical protein